MDGFSFDYGAQFFTARTPEFIELVNRWNSKGAVARWDARFVEMDSAQVTLERQWNEEFPHYVGSPGMSAIAT